MEIPDADELEWLESDAQLIPEDEYEDLEDRIDFPPVLPEHQQSDIIQRAHKKRPPSGTGEIDVLQHSGSAITAADCDLSEHATATACESGSKRRALEVDLGDEWLRYSPRYRNKEPVEMREKEQAVSSVNNVTISRFACAIDGDCMPVTGPGGRRVYAKLVSCGVFDGRNRKILASKVSNQGLLAESIKELSRRAEQVAFAKALQESLGSQDRNTSSTTEVVTEELWVEKYAPDSFTELLSDEHTNREVLLWLKKWDAFVFGTPLRATTEDVLSALRAHSSVGQIQKSSYIQSFSSKKFGALSSNKKPDSLGTNGRENYASRALHGSSSIKTLVDSPPEQKVLLLCGPPGLGKTTLAHVAAKHCGYRAIEINASDDRTASSIESKILDVVQMNSVTLDSKPKCLIIDEIDGALNDGKGAVDVILKMINFEKEHGSDRRNASEESQLQKVSTRKRHKTTKLSRPVICICNDLYAPALRQLRQVAKVHTFVRPSISRVVNRLKYICKNEGFKTNGIALSTLAEHTECDIRSCLNTLQFLNKKGEAVNILDVDSQVIGQKDLSKSAFDVWKEIFHSKGGKCDVKLLNACKETGLDHTYSIIFNSGEYELTMDGIYENYCHLSYHDPMMQKTAQCLDVLGISDLLLNYVFRSQQMSLHAYQPSIAITVKNLIAQVEKPSIEWPKSTQRCRAMCMEKKDILKTWQNQIAPIISRHFSVESFAHEVASPLLHILSPPRLRPVALHLLSEGEKDELAQLVDTMVSYSVTYKATKHETSQLMTMTSDLPLSMDPPVQDFVSFKEHHSAHFMLSSAVKQVLLHEIEKHKIIQGTGGRSLGGTDKGNNNQDDSTSSTNISGSEPIRFHSKQKTTFTQNQLGCSAAKNAPGMSVLKNASSLSPNFFDRCRKESGSKAKSHWNDSQKAGTAGRDSRPLLFKYNEGYTNAVKRPIKMRDLLP